MRSCCLVKAVGIAVGLATGADSGSGVSITAVAVDEGALVGDGVAGDNDLTGGVEAERAETVA